MSQDKANSGRDFLKAGFGHGGFLSDQAQGVPHPPPQTDFPPDAAVFDLERPEHLGIGSMPVEEAINRRRSRRQFADHALPLDSLAYLLWSTQGVQEVLRDGLALLRTVPSAGARHAFETYLVVNRVEGLEPGLYRYLSLEHKLARMGESGNLSRRAAQGCHGQDFVQQASAVFVWTAVPYRMEWRYGPMAAKLIALDAGHVCQNLYLACESIGAGTCAIAAYRQDDMDALVGVDGDDEFVVYIAAVGTLR